VQVRLDVIITWFCIAFLMTKQKHIFYARISRSFSILASNKVSMFFFMTFMFPPTTFSYWNQYKPISGHKTFCKTILMIKCVGKHYTFHQFAILLLFFKCVAPMPHPSLATLWIRKHNGYHLEFESTMATIYTNIKNSACCTQNVFMSPLWFSQ